VNRVVSCAHRVDGPLLAVKATAMADLQVRFGFKIAWLAVRRAPQLTVARSLRLQGVQPCSWVAGVQAAYAGTTVFITPRIGDWTLAVSGALPSADRPNWIPFLSALGAAFEEVQYFGTHRVGDYCAWARVVNGVVVRAYADPEGISIGAVSEDEHALGFRFLDDIAEDDETQLDTWLADDGSMVIPDEMAVQLLAGRWSVNPQLLTAEDVRGAGLRGDPPAAGWPAGTLSQQLS
jgi:hypothetical protein